MIYLKELDTLKKKKKKSGSLSSTSVPNLSSIVSDDDDLTTDEQHQHPNDSKLRTVSSHFQRNVVRKSRFARGAVKLLQNKLNLTTLKSSKSNDEDSFKRFGSLQNLKQYQSEPTWPSSSSTSHILTEPKSEMMEKFDALELESRMHQYWSNGTGVTCF